MPPGTEYEVVGAYGHEQKGRSAGITRTDYQDGKLRTNRDIEDVYKGIEIVVKVKKNAHKPPKI